MNVRLTTLLRDPKNFVGITLDYLKDYSRIPYLKECRRSRGEPNAVFIWIPKTAGTSLFRAINCPKFPKLRYVKYRFCGRGVVTFSHRNPYARAVSLHAYLVKHEKLPSYESFLDFCRRLRDYGCEPIGLYNTSGLNQCNPQLRWVENTELDLVGRVESIDGDAAVIFDRLGLPGVSIPMLNTTSHSEYQDCYCRESKEIVEEFYADDLEAFDYEFEDFLRSYDKLKV